MKNRSWLFGLVGIGILAFVIWRNKTPKTAPETPKTVPDILSTVDEIMVMNIENLASTWTYIHELYQSKQIELEVFRPLSAAVIKRSRELGIVLPHIYYG